ncbi:MAG: hypothetical protein ACK56I_13090, partial [bacterium]
MHGIILVHDLSNRKSCLNLNRWLAEVRIHVVGRTVGNHVSLFLEKEKSSQKLSLRVPELDSFGSGSLKFRFIFF